MTEHELPEDISRWPNDPHALLGVPRGTSGRDLKRAYTNLLRKYKPEQFPEQFRLIRVAYETLLSHAEWMANSVPDSPRTGVSGTDQEPATPGATLGPTPDSCWALALDGRAEEGYRGLCELHDRNPGSEEIYLRLYWLLWVRPELDSQRAPFDWLVQGIKSICRRGPLLQLMTEEVDENPGEALSDSYANLLEATLPGDILAELLDWRWLAADRLGALSVCAQDLNQMRTRIADKSEIAWLRCVIILAGRTVSVVTGPQARLFQDCVVECQRLKHLALNLPHDFDRLDHLVEMRDQWIKVHNLKSFPEPLLRVLAVGPNRPFEDCRPSFEQILDYIRADPAKWLGHFDAMQAAAPMILATFGSLLEQFSYLLPKTVEDTRDNVSLRRLAVPFLNRHQQPSYRLYRVTVLAFCIEETISPERLANVTSDYLAAWPASNSSLAHALLVDWPLRLVYQADRLFWA